MNLVSKTKALLATLLLVAVPLAGCGGGDEGAVSESEFLARGDQICQQVYSRITRRYSKLSGNVAASVNSGSNPERRMNLGTQRFVVPAMEELVRRLRALGAPEEKAGRFAKTLASLETGIERAARDPRAARGSEGVEYAFQDGGERLLALGLDRCRQE